MEHVSIKASDHHQLHIHKDSRGDTWIKAVWTFETESDRIIEYLICEDFEEGIFRMTARTVEGTVSIILLARRNTQFPLKSKIRLASCI